MAACRCYYSQVSLDPSRALTYVRENTEKQIVYEQILYNQYTNISAGAAWSNLIQSGIKNPISVLIIPFISSLCGVKVTSGALSGSALGFTQYGSPYDTSPSSYAPISLTNLSVTLGGVNVLNTSYNYKGGQPKLKNLEKNSARANRRELTGACMHFGVFRTC
jgi:hypothetical protein